MGLIKSKIFPLLAGVKKFFINSFLFVVRLIFFWRRGKKLENLDKKLVYSLSRSRFPSLSQLKHWSRALSSGEKTAIKIFLLLIFASLFFISFCFIRGNLRVAPIAGGRYSEALVGSPKYINPLYAEASDVDGDLARLIFSSLFRYDKEGKLVGDLASGYQVSADGKIYDIEIKDGARWHSGGQVTAEDVLFTFNAIKNPAYNSLSRANFESIGAEVRGDRKIRFLLPEKLSSFLEFLTFGVLPEELWREISPAGAPLAELNMKPIGSGPYKFKSLIKDKSGNIKSYVLTANSDYYGVRPYIKELIFKFFPNFSEAIIALNGNKADGINYLPPENRQELAVSDSLNIHKFSLAREKNIFFNQKNNPSLGGAKVRKALSLAIDKDSLIKDVLDGDAFPAFGPLPTQNFFFNSRLKENYFNLEEAKKLLDEAGWEKFEISQEEIEGLLAREARATSAAGKLTETEELKKNMGAGTWRVKKEEEKNKTVKNKKPALPKFLTVSLTAIDDEENNKVAETISSYWRALGVKTKVNLLPVAKIQAETIDKRDFEALLFSQIVGFSPDVYIFWHSSQAGKGGLNLSSYISDEADRAMEDARLSTSTEATIANYYKFQEAVATDTPAIFLYSPLYFYPQSKEIKGFDIKYISAPADRFNNISEWYIKTGKRLEW